MSVRLHLLHRLFQEVKGTTVKLIKKVFSYILGLKRFCNYPFGHPFILYVDCKPLQSILAKYSAKPALSATCLLYYAIFCKNAIAEFVIGNQRKIQCRFSVMFSSENGCKKRMNEPSVVVNLMHQISMLPLSLQELAAEIKTDSEITTILERLYWVFEKWRIEACRNFLQNIYCREWICPLWHKSVCFRKFQSTVLQKFHECNLGISKMKGLTRSHVYWPGVDDTIESLVRCCK